MPAKRRRAAKPPAPNRPTPAATVEYPEWRALAGATLERLGEVKAATVAERHWKRFFIQGLCPNGQPSAPPPMGTCHGQPPCAAGKAGGDEADRCNEILL